MKRKGDGCMLTENQLTQYARKFLADNYHMELKIPIVYNGRLQKACGRFLYYANNNPRPVKIDINKRFAEMNEYDVVLDVLRHELVHYAMWSQGKPHSDGDILFERELKRLGVVSQSTIDKYTIKSLKQVYKCTKCKCEFKRNRRLSLDGAGHRCSCGGHIQYLGRLQVSS